MFVVTTTPTERVREYCTQCGGSGLYTAGDGECQRFYRPYHLLGIETTVSVANAALRNEATGVADRHVSEVVGVAKRDPESGDEVDDGGGDTVYGRIESAEGARDELVSSADVELDTDSLLHHLRRLQEETL